MAKNQVVVSVTSNVKDLQKGLNSAGGSFSTLTKVAAAAAVAVAAATVAIGVKAVKSASNLEQAMGGLEAVFKGNTKQMATWASGAANSVGLAKSEYAQLSTILGAQLKNMGVATGQLAGQTDSLVRLGADLAAQFGGSTSDAVSALSSLMRGERDPIERYGVSLKQADINARLAEKGMSGLTGEALKQATTVATLELLYEQTADAQGAFARESATLAGQQQRLQANFENIYATLGTELLPAATAVTGAFNMLLGKVQESAAFETFLGWVNSASAAFADFVNGIAEGKSLDFGDLFSGLLDAAVNGITGAANWLATGGATTLVNGLVEGRTALFDAAFKMFPAILEALVQSIPAIVTGLVALVTQLAQMLVTQAPIILNGAVQLFQSLITALVTILPGLITTILGLLPVLIESLLGMIPTILDAAVLLFTSLIDAIPVILPPLIQTIVELLPKLVESILSMLPKVLEAAIGLFIALVESLPIILPLLLKAIIDLLPKLVVTILKMLPDILMAAIKLFTGIITAIPKILPELITAIIEMLPEIIGALIGMIPDLIQAGIDLIGGLIQGLWDAGAQVGEALLSIIQDAIGGFLSFLGIASPSKVFSAYGKNVVQGLVKGLDGSEKLVDKSMKSLSGAVTDGFDASLSAPELQLAVSSGGAGGGSMGNVYNVEVYTLNASAETGRVIVQSIRDYERAGGRL